MPTGRATGSIFRGSTSARATPACSTWSKSATQSPSAARRRARAWSWSRRRWSRARPVNWLRKLLGGGPSRRKRPRKAAARPVAPRRRPAARRPVPSHDTRARQALERESARWIARDDRRRLAVTRAAERDQRAELARAERADRKERERAGSARIKSERSERAMLDRLAKRANKQRERAIATYLSWGMSPAEADQMYERSGDDTLGERNPRRRNPEAS